MRDRPIEFPSVRVWHGKNLLLLLLPFVLFHWMTPGLGDQTLGNDYTLFTPNDQLNLMFSVCKGSFPLFIPGYWYGQSSSALTLGQVHHPVAWISSLLPYYWAGEPVACLTGVKLLSLGLAQLALFSLLRRMRYRTSVAFLISFITVYNLRMLDIFRYNASLESFTGMLFLCAAAGWYSLEPENKLAPFAIAGATYWTITGGHPQMAYFGMAGAGAWIVLFPMVARTLVSPVNGRREPLSRFWLKTGFWVGVGGALSACYLLPFYVDFVRENSARVTQGYEWSVMWADTPSGMLANFFLPLRSDCHGAFGGSSLFLAAILGIVTGMWNARTRKACLLLGASATLLFLFAMGAGTPFHHWCWTFIPLCRAIRGPGRIFQIMPLILMLGLMTSVSNSPPEAEKETKDTPLFFSLILAFFAYLLCPLLPFWNEVKLGNYPALKVNGLASWCENPLYATGLLTLFLMIMHIWRKRSMRISTMLCVSAVLQVGLLMPCGTWTIPADCFKKPTFAQLAESLRLRLGLLDSRGEGLEAPLVTSHLAEGGDFDPRMATAYRSFRKASSREEAFRLLRESECRNPARSDVPLVLAEDIPGFIPSVETGQEYQIKTVYSSYNRLAFSCSARPGGGLFKLNYPFSKKWSCSIDGNPTRIVLANNAEMAVPVPPGTSTVEFRYSSESTVWGWAITALTLGFLAGAVGVAVFTVRGWGMVPLILGSLSISGGVFGLWHHSLYTGDSLNTVYEYRSGEPITTWERRAIAFDRGNLTPVRQSSRWYLSGKPGQAPPWAEYDFIMDSPGDYRFILKYLASGTCSLQFSLNGRFIQLSLIHI